MCPFSWLSCVSGQFFLVVIIQSRLPPPLPQPPPVLSHHSRYILLTAWAGPRLDAQRGPGIHSCPQRLGARFSLESDVGSQEGRAASSSSCCVPHFPEGCVCLPTQCWGAAWTSHQDSSPCILAALRWGGPSALPLGLGIFVSAPLSSMLPGHAWPLFLLLRSVSTRSRLEPGKLSKEEERLTQPQ